MSTFALYYVFIGLGVLLAAFMQVMQKRTALSSGYKINLHLSSAARRCAGSWRASDKFTDCGKSFSPKSFGKTPPGLTGISQAIWLTNCPSMHTASITVFIEANLFSFDFGRSDMERIREGLGSKFSMVAQYVSTFVSGLIVGLADNWRLTLVILVIAPFLIGTSGYMAKV